MNGRNLPALFVLLALLLIGAFWLDRLDLVSFGGVPLPLSGWRLACALALFFTTATLCAALPTLRFQLLLAASLLQLFLLYPPLETVGALLLWTAFYHVVHLRVSWWVRAPAIASLYVAPLLIGGPLRPSGLFGALMILHYASNFVLRAPLYAYEATKKRELMEGAGYSGFLLHLIALPLTAIKTAPIGFLVLHRGFRQATDPALIRRGTGEIALGLAYLTALKLGGTIGLLPSHGTIALAADGLDALTALVAGHLLLLRLFFEVAGDVHMAVGMLRVLGFDIPAGTDRPYLSRNILDFWRRWNTYYRDYLMTLAYYPVAVALKRHPSFAVVAAGLATFLLNGFTHALRYFVGNWDLLSLKGVLVTHIPPLAQGILVTIWMVRERRTGRGRPHGKGGRAAGAGGPWSGVRVAVSVAATLTIMCLILMLFARPFGWPHPASFGIMDAYLRLPAW